MADTPSPHVDFPPSEQLNLAMFTIEKKIGKGQFSEVPPYFKTNKNPVGIPGEMQLEWAHGSPEEDPSLRDGGSKGQAGLPQGDRPPQTAESRQRHPVGMSGMRGGNQDNYRYYASFIDNNQLNIVLELAEAGDMSRMIKVHLLYPLTLPSILKRTAV